VQGTLLQHGFWSEHCWPYAEQGGSVGGGVLASVPEGGGGVVVVEPPHDPTVDPGGMLHAMPAQQSAVVVQPPPDGMHAPPHTSAPLAFGVHGRPQQSALDAQALPVNAAGLVQSISAMRQRGMPSESCLQVSAWITLPAQQSALALHSFVFRRQIAPAGVHACPLVHRPSAAPPDLEHVTFVLSPSGSPADPQQSLSSLQSSPVGLQPLGF
jgi:hypothetical protein